MRTLFRWIAVCIAAMACTAPCPATPAITFYSGGIDALQQHEKDRALHEALLLLQQVGFDLPVPMAPNEREALDLLMDMLLGRMGGTVTFDDAAIARGDMEAAVRVQLAFYGNDGVTPESLHERLMRLLDTMGPLVAPVEGSDGMVRLGEDPDVYLGVMEVVDASALVIGVNQLPPGNAAIKELGAIGPGTWSAGSVDFERMSTIMNAAMAVGRMQGATMPGMGPQDVIETLSRMGFMGPDALRFEWNIASSGDTGRTDFTLRNYRQHYGAILSDAVVQREDLQLVPEDATWMSASALRLSAVTDLFASASRTPEGRAVEPTPWDMISFGIKSLTGIDPQTQFLDHLGEHLVVYQSDTTGGGGLMSTVAVVGLADADGMAQSMQTVRANLNRLATRQADGYVRLVNWSAGDCGDLTTLTFPALPVPLELTMAVCGGRLVLGLSPQAVVAAIRQFDAERSILDNSAFRSADGMKGIGSAMGIQFLDVPARLADGYPWMNMPMAAVSNWSRPRSEPGRGVNMVLPTYPELARGARANVMQITMDEDDLVARCTGDPSFMVQMTALAADTMTLGVPMAAAVVGAVLPAVGNARDSAKKVETMNAGRMVATGISLYMQDHADTYPDSLDVLVEQGYIEPSMLVGLRTGRPWVYRVPDEAGRKWSSTWPLLLESEDLYRFEDGIVVVFADGHTRIIRDPAELEHP